MPTSLPNILSKVQRTLDDEEFSKVKRAELIDFIDDAIHMVSATVRIWIEQFKVTPYEAVEDFTVATEADLAGIAGPTEGQTAIVTETSERWRYRLGAWETSAYNVVQIDPEVTRVHKFLQVWRNGANCEEVSYQAARMGYDSGYLFPETTNDEARLTSGTQFASVRRTDDGTDLFFTRDFALGESVVIVYLREKPYTPAMWKDNIEIPDSVAQAIEWKTTSMAMEKLYLRGDQTMGERAQWAANRAKTELNNANAYLRGLLNENSKPKSRPIKWLSDGERY